MCAMIVLVCERFNWSGLSTNCCYWWDWRQSADTNTSTHTHTHRQMSRISIQLEIGWFVCFGLLPNSKSSWFLRRTRFDFNHFRLYWSKDFYCMFEGIQHNKSIKTYKMKYYGVDSSQCSTCYNSQIDESWTFLIRLCFIYWAFFPNASNNKN